jgi:hypothetical protein
MEPAVEVLRYRQTDVAQRPVELRRSAAGGSETHAGDDREYDPE